MMIISNFIIKGIIFITSVCCTLLDGKTGIFNTRFNASWLRLKCGCGGTLPLLELAPVANFNVGAVTNFKVGVPVGVAAVRGGGCAGAACATGVRDCVACATLPATTLTTGIVGVRGGCDSFSAGNKGILRDSASVLPPLCNA